LGRFIDNLLPDQAVTAAAGIAFIVFGAWTLRGDKLDDDPTAKRGRWGSLATVAFTFFIAELGDKTMLATITPATGIPSLIGYS
jgi:putative Ca2+/H+ antiporter (TMEM165/GDT1 family)